MTDGSYDDNGDFVESEAQYGCWIPCRYEPNGKAQSISLGDGRIFLYNYTVYLDRFSPEFAFGDMVEIKDQFGKKLGDYQVQGFHRGQLNCKLWV